MYNVVRGRAVGGDGDIVHDRNAQKRFYVGVVRLRRQRVPKENDYIYLALGDLCAYLLIAAQRSGQIPLDVELCRLAYQFGGRARTAQLELRKRALVFERPIDDLRLFVIVRNERYCLFCFHTLHITYRTAFVNPERDKSAV